MIKKILSFALGIVLAFSSPLHAQSMDSQADLEKVFASFSNVIPNPLPPNTIEHKATRWAQHKSKESGVLAFSTWSKQYDSNMTKARDAADIEKKYMAAIGWGEHNKSREVPGQTGKRRIDISDLARQKGVEVKAYETGTVYNTDDMKAEYAMDAKLIKAGWQMEWVFLGCVPSGPLKAELEQRGIKITLK
jgi:hypothetical protein